MYVEHDEQAQRRNGGLIACFDRQVVRNPGQLAYHRIKVLRSLQAKSDDITELSMQMRASGPVEYFLHTHRRDDVRFSALPGDEKRGKPPKSELSTLATPLLNPTTWIPSVNCFWQVWF